MNNENYDHIFQPNPLYYGGTEYMVKTFKKEILPNLVNITNYNCIVIPGLVIPLTKYLDNEKDFVVWLHNTPKQFNNDVIVFLTNKVFLEKLKYIIVPSNAAKEKVIEEINIPSEKIYVISNAISPAKINVDKFENTSSPVIVNTSSFDRGTPILLDSITGIDKNFRVELYNDFYPDLLENCPEIDSRVVCYGKTPKKTVLEAISNSHIFAYPSIYYETFCLSLAEAMSAGNLPIYPDYGALKEISGGRGLVYDYVEDIRDHIHLFKEKLEIAIEMIKDNAWDPTEQIRYINDNFSWENILKQWIEFDKKL